MSPLTRSLLALACAALLHASSADLEESIRAAIPNWNLHWPCGKLEMGITKDENSKKVTLKNIYVPPKKSLMIPSVAKPDEALIGQTLVVCDPTGLAKQVSVKPVNQRAHSPIKVHCEPPGACPKGTVAFTDQHVIKQLA